MRAPPSGFRPLALAALAAAALLSCTYAPDFKNGTLLCGSLGSCPKGYHCVAGHTCYKEGSTPNDDGGTGGSDGGTGGATGSGGASGGPVGDRNDLVGTWGFTSGMLAINCSDNTSQTKDLQGPTDHLDVTVGAGNGISADFYCNWALDLTISSGKGQAKLQMGQQTCMSTGGCSDFTWTGHTFDFTAADSANGSLNGRIDATYKDYTDTVTLKNTGQTVCLPKATAMPATGSCTLTVNGMLTKE